MRNALIMSSSDETLSVNLNANCPFKAKYTFTPSQTCNCEKSTSGRVSNCMFLNGPNNHLEDLFNLPNFVDLEQDFALKLRNRHCKLEQQLGILEGKVIRLMDDVNDQTVPHRSTPELNDGDVLCKDNHKFLVLLIHRLLNELHTTKLQHQQAIDKMNIRYEKLLRTIKWLQSIPNEPQYLERIGAGDQCMDLMH